MPLVSLTEKTHTIAPRPFVRAEAAADIRQGLKLFGASFTEVAGTSAAEGQERESRLPYGTRRFAVIYRDECQVAILPRRRDRTGKAKIT